MPQERISASAAGDLSAGSAVRALCKVFGQPASSMGRGNVVLISATAFKRGLDQLHLFVTEQEADRLRGVYGVGADQIDLSKVRLPLRLRLARARLSVSHDAARGRRVTQDPQPNNRSLRNARVARRKAAAAVAPLVAAAAHN